MTSDGILVVSIGKMPWSTGALGRRVRRLVVTVIGSLLRLPCRLRGHRVACERRGPRDHAPRLYRCHQRTRPALSRNRRLRRRRTSVAWLARSIVEPDEGLAALGSGGSA